MVWPSSSTTLFHLMSSKRALLPLVRFLEAPAPLPNSEESTWYVVKTTSHSSTFDADTCRPSPWKVWNLIRPDRKCSSIWVSQLLRTLNGQTATNGKSHQQKACTRRLLEAFQRYLSMWCR